MIVIITAFAANVSFTYYLVLLSSSGDISLLDDPQFLSQGQNNNKNNKDSGEGGGAGISVEILSSADNDTNNDSKNTENNTETKELTCDGRYIRFAAQVCVGCGLIV